MLCLAPLWLACILQFSSFPPLSYQSNKYSRMPSLAVQQWLVFTLLNTLDLYTDSCQSTLLTHVIPHSSTFRVKNEYSRIRKKQISRDILDRKILKNYQKFIRSKLSIKDTWTEGIVGKNLFAERSQKAVRSLGKI